MNYGKLHFIVSQIDSHLFNLPASQYKTEIEYLHKILEEKKPCPLCDPLKQAKKEIILYEKIRDRLVTIENSARICLTRERK